MSEGNGRQGIDLGQDEGFMAVTLGGETHRIDVWETYCRLVKAAEGPPERAEFGRRAVMLLREAGFAAQEVSLLAGERFSDAVFAAVTDLKKKATAGATPASPGSTGPAS